MKTLKEHGVPFGARAVAALQWVPFMAAALIMVLALSVSLPLLLLWVRVSADSLQMFLNGIVDVFEKRKEQMDRHREKLIAMYSVGANCRRGKK